MSTDFVRRRDLDFVRGIAILLACGWHFNGRDTGVRVIDALQMPGRLIGWAGVDLFFVLSGFLVGGLIFREHQKTGGFRADRFLVRRAFKIWPVLYAYLVILLITKRYSINEILPAFFHLQNYISTPTKQLWSLAVEEHFYVVFAALFTWFAARSRGDLALIPKFLLAIIFCAFALRCGGILLGADRYTLQLQTQFRADALACGVLLAYVRCFNEGLFERICQRKAMCGMASAAGVAILIWQRDNQLFISSAGYSITALTSVAFVLFVQNSRMNSSRNPFLRMIAWLGVYSYSMYVFQFVLWRAGEAAFSKFGVQLAPLPDLALKYGGAIIAAVMVTKLVERPVLALRERMYPASRAIKSTALTAKA